MGCFFGVATQGEIMTKVAIVQSCYIPWKGYFDLINMVDDFVLFDEVQYTRRDWRNRNKIKTDKGLLWLTIPVDVKGNYFQAIKDTKIADSKWQSQHWNSIKHYYSKAIFFKQYYDFFNEIYGTFKEKYLSIINYEFLIKLNELLGIGTRLHWSGDFEFVKGKTERLLCICKRLKASTYVSGPSARDYLDESMFEGEGISVEWMDYGGYPEYRQLYPPFEHAVSIIDLILNEGPNAPEFMKSFNR